MANAAANVLRRALLYVPASSPKFLDKSLGLTVDTICYDLEDSVAPDRKDEARSQLLEFLQNGPRPAIHSETAVRINSLSSGGNLAEKDLKMSLSAPNLDAVVMTKVNSKQEVQWAHDMMTHMLPKRNPANPTPEQRKKAVKIIALIESARAITELQSICQGSPYLDGLIFAAEDFALDLSITRTPSLSEFLYARSAIVTHARAANLSSTIDLVCTSFRGEKGLKTLEEECLGGKNLGFNGKQCIHPSQVDVVQRAFAPAMEEVEWAIRVVIGGAKAEASGRGAWTLDGKMIDAPVVGKAQAVVSRAERCGINVNELKQKWESQEPE